MSCKKIKKNHCEYISIIMHVCSWRGYPNRNNTSERSIFTKSTPDLLNYLPRSLSEDRSIAEGAASGAASGAEGAEGLRNKEDGDVAVAGGELGLAEPKDLKEANGANSKAEARHGVHLLMCAIGGLVYPLPSLTLLEPENKTCESREEARVFLSCLLGSLLNLRQRRWHAPRALAWWPKSPVPTSEHNKRDMKNDQDHLEFPCPSGNGLGRSLWSAPALKIHAPGECDVL